MNVFRLGEVSITRVVETGRSFYPTADMLPESTAGAIARHHAWLKPDFFDEATGDLGSRIQTWVVRMPGRTILIDTGVGNGKERHESPLWHHRQGTWLDDRRARRRGLRDCSRGCASSPRRATPPATSPCV